MTDDGGWAAVKDLLDRVQDIQRKVDDIETESVALSVASERNKFDLVAIERVIAKSNTIEAEIAVILAFIETKLGE